MKAKVIRTATIAVSLDYLLKGQLSFLEKYFDVLAVSGKDDHLDVVRKRESVRTVNISMQRSISLINDLKSLWQLYCLFRKEKPQIVHSITPKAGLLSMIAAKMAGVPIRMHTFTGLIFPTRTGLMQKILIKMDKFLCWAATNVYPEGKGVRNDKISYKITSKPLKVLANGNVNGIDLEYFAPNQISEEQKLNLKKRLNIKQGEFVFVFVGRLVGDKGINELVKAFKRLDSPNSKLLMVGPLEVDLDPLLAETMQEIENNKNIISVGFQKDVRPYFAISDLLTFPSYREGFPNVVMQAGAMGLPSIVSNISGCNEIIEEGKNGVIIPVKNTEILQQMMSKMMCEKTYYNQLKENARFMIENRYEQSVVWNALLEEYTILIKQLAN